MFSPAPEWPHLPEGWEFSMVTGVACDSRGRIYVAHRGPHPLICFDADGKFLRTVGEGDIQESVYYKLNRTPATAMGRRFWIHGLSVDPWDNVWITDVGRHVVMKYTPEGQLALTMGRADISGETPTLFNQPTHVLVTPDGDIYVTDGYGNSRVVRFSPDGKYLLSWGARGTGPGEFDIPHAMTMDDKGRIYVADRSNCRIQVFRPDGEFLAACPNLGAIDAVVICGDVLYASGGQDNRIFKLDLSGRLLGAWGSKEVLGFPHGLCLDGEGNLFVAEILANRARKLRILQEAPKEIGEPPNDSREAQGTATAEFRDGGPAGLGEGKPAVTLRGHAEA